MKMMKAALLKFSLLVFMIIPFYVPTCSAWNHGYPNGNTFAYTPVDYYEPVHYGIYDWFADQVLIQLSAYQITYNEFWFQYWRKEILFGTELISNSSNSQCDLIINATEILRCDGESKYYLEWDANNSLPLNQAYYVRGDLIKSALQEAISQRKFDVASVYLGMFCSFFALTTYFPSFFYNKTQIYGVYLQPMAYDLYFYKNRLVYEINNAPTQDMDFELASFLSAEYSGFYSNSWTDPNTTGIIEIDNQWLMDTFEEFLYESSYDHPKLQEYYNNINLILNYGISQCASFLYYFFNDIGLRLTQPIENPYGRFVQTKWQSAVIIASIFVSIGMLYFILLQREKKLLLSGHYWKKQMQKQKN